MKNISDRSLNLMKLSCRYVTIFRFVVGDLQRAYNILFHEGDSDKEICVISANPFDQENYPVQQAEAVCIFNLCALAEICNTKTNLIAVCYYLCIIHIYCIRNYFL